MDPFKYSKALKAVSSKGKVVKYSHQSFLSAIHADPADANHRAIYADWLEDNASHSVTPETLHFLRTHEGEGWARQTADGRVEAGPAEIPSEDMGLTVALAHPFSFPQRRTELVHRVHGPNGSYGVIKHTPMDPTLTPDYQTVHFRPTDYLTAHFHDTPEQALQEAHQLSGLHD